MIVTDLLDQVIQVPLSHPWNGSDFCFGRVRAVYHGEGGLRLVVAMTNGYLADILADSAKVKLPDDLAEKVRKRVDHD